MLELARAARFAGRAEKAVARSAKLLDRAAGLPSGSAQDKLFKKGTDIVNKSDDFKILFGKYPQLYQDFGASSRLMKAANLTKTSGLGSISARLDEAATTVKGVRRLESDSKFPLYDVPFLGGHRSLADARVSAAATLQQLSDVMPELKSAARGQQLAVAGIGGAAVLGAAGGTAYLATRA